MTLYEAYTKAKEAFNSIETDILKADKGNAAAQRRVRGFMRDQNIKNKEIANMTKTIGQTEVGAN